jgi:hypothetical protein
MPKATEVHDLPPDNGSRLAIYDAISDHAEATGAPEISDSDLFERVIGRLRVLVPRELYNVGEQAYLDEKIDACLEAGIVAARFENGRRLLALTDRPPHVRYPDGGVRDYPAGLELARERLDRDNMRLRESGFDVRKFIPSIANDPRGASFQALLASMHEHGFMKQFPIVKYDDGVIIDGLARQRAAEELQLDVEYMKYWSDKDRNAARRRDTPLNRVLVAINSNIDRIPGNVVEAVHKRVAKVTLRSWDETAADLALTQEWRGARAPEYTYTPWFEVQKLAYRPDDDPKVQVTADGKVMVRSLVEAGGLASYKIKTQLGELVPIEKARTAYSGGRKADFAAAKDLIAGIEAMQLERSASHRKIDPEWEQIRSWLVRNLGADGS